MTILAGLPNGYRSPQSGTKPPRGQVEPIRKLTCRCAVFSSITLTRDPAEGLEAVTRHALPWTH